MSVLLALPEIRFGYGSRSELTQVLESLGVKRPLIVTDVGVANSGGIERIVASNPSLSFAVFQGVSEPPTFSGVDAAADVYLHEECDGIVAVGGGSVIDTAKMAAVIATHSGKAEDYCGKSEMIVAEIAPLVTVPTTSGSGSEVSPSTGMHPAAGVAALRTRAPQLLAKVAICDPELTISMPPRLTAVTGLDALTHCIEGYLSPVTNPVIDAIALAGIRRISQNLVRSVENGADREARSELMLGSLEGGISIAKGLGPAHAVATALSHWAAPHGLLAAVSLPPSLELMQDSASARLADIAAAMKLPQGTSATQGFHDLMSVVMGLTGLPINLSSFRDGNTDVGQLAISSHASPVNRTSPYHPTVEEFYTLISRVLQ